MEVREQVYLELQPSEMAIFRAASSIYSAYVSSGQVLPGEENTYMQKAIREAIQIAYAVERHVQSDDETATKKAFVEF